MGKIKEILNNFRLRKRILAVADAFIVVVAGLIVNYPLPLFANRIGRPDLFVVFLTTSICCFGSLLFFGAYNRMWRYFSTKDYFSCIYGVVTGIVIANVFVYVIKGDCAWEFAILHATVATVGICMFRYIFKRAFVSLVATGAKAAENTSSVTSISSRPYFSLICLPIPVLRSWKEGRQCMNTHLSPAFFKTSMVTR